MTTTSKIEPVVSLSSYTATNPKTNNFVKSNSKAGRVQGATLGFAIMLFSASFSTGIEYTSSSHVESSSTISYKNMTENIYDISILQNFISNILMNSVDIDSDVVDMVNENFWDLI